MLGRKDLRGRLTRRWQSEISDHVSALAWSPDKKWVAAAAVSGPVTVFDAGNGTARLQLSGHTFGTSALGWSADALHLASAGQDGQVRFWDQTGSERLAVPGGSAWVERLAWHPTAALLATAAGRVVRLWNSDGQMVRAFSDHAGTVNDLAWRPGTRTLAAAARGNVTLWSVDQDAALEKFEGQGAVLALAWSPDGKILASGEQDASVHFRILSTRQNLLMSGYPTKVRELAWDASGRYLATGGAAAVTVWDCSGKGPEGKKPLQFEGHEGLVRVLAFQRTGPLLASGGSDGNLVLWQPGKFKSTLSKSDLGAEVTQVVWAADDLALVAGSAAGKVVAYGVS